MDGCHELKGKSILITGSGGFVGRRLAKALGNRFSLIVKTHKELDLLDAVAVEQCIAHSGEVGTVIHCAAVGGSRLTKYDAGHTNVVEQNLRMFFNVARCIKPQQRLIYLGSGAEYDRTHYAPKMTEEYFDSHVPEDAYGFSKYCISKFIAQNDNMICLRIFGLYGQGEDYRYKFISNSIIKGLLGLPITIAQNVIFDYLFIADFMMLVERLLHIEWPCRHMNITPTKSIDLLSIAELVNKSTGNRAGIKVLNQGYNTEYTGDNNRLLKVIGPIEFTPYQEGIHAMTDYYRSVWDRLDLETVRTDPYLNKCIVRQ